MISTWQVLSLSSNKQIIYYVQKKRFTITFIAELYWHIGAVMIIGAYGSCDASGGVHDHHDKQCVVVSLYTPCLLHLSVGCLLTLFSFYADKSTRLFVNGGKNKFLGRCSIIILSEKWLNEWIPFSQEQSQQCNKQTDNTMLFGITGLVWWCYCLGSFVCLRNKTEKKTKRNSSSSLWEILV